MGCFIKIFELVCYDNMYKIYMKEHKNEELLLQKPEETTLFIIGTPPFMTKAAYRSIFSQFGNVLQIVFQPCPSSDDEADKNISLIESLPVKGFKVAYLVFEEKSSVTKALLASRLVLPDKDSSEEEIEENEDEKSTLMECDKPAAESQSEKWEKPKLKGHHKRRAFSRNEKNHNAIMRKKLKKDTEKQIRNFYNFQMYGKKGNELVEVYEKLKKKQEQDKFDHKNKRKFRPMTL